MRKVKVHKRPWAGRVGIGAAIALGVSMGQGVAFALPVDESEEYYEYPLSYYPPGYAASQEPPATGPCIPSYPPQTPPCSPSPPPTPPPPPPHTNPPLGGTCAAQNLGTAPEQVRRAAEEFIREMGQIVPFANGVGMFIHEGKICAVTSFNIESDGVPADDPIRRRIADDMALKIREAIVKAAKRRGILWGISVAALMPHVQRAIDCIVTNPRAHGIDPALHTEPQSRKLGVGIVFCPEEIIFVLPNDGRIIGRVISPAIDAAQAVFDIVRVGWGNWAIWLMGKVEAMILQGEESRKEMNTLKRQLNKDGLDPAAQEILQQGIEATRQFSLGARSHLSSRPEVEGLLYNLIKDLRYLRHSINPQDTRIGMVATRGLMTGILQGLRNLLQKSWDPSWISY